MWQAIGTRIGALAILGAVAGACGPPVGLFFAGDGDGTTPPFTLADGSYHIRWTFHDPKGGDHGCLFGLAIRLREPARLGQDGRATGSSRKLVYRSIDAGVQGSGDAPSVTLVAGTYVLDSEGACAWEARILPAEPGASDDNPRFVE